MPAFLSAIFESSNEEFPGRRTYVTASTVLFMRKSSTASSYVAAHVSPRGRACLTRTYESPKVERGNTLEPVFIGVTVTPLKSPIASASVYGMRVVFSDTAEAQLGQDRHYDDLFFFTARRAVVMLRLAGIGAPFPVAQERRLVSLLHSRAEAHRL